MEDFSDLIGGALDIIVELHRENRAEIIGDILDNGRVVTSFINKAIAMQEDIEKGEKGNLELTNEENMFLLRIISFFKKESDYFLLKFGHEITKGVQEIEEIAARTYTPEEPKEA